VTWEKRTHQFAENKAGKQIGEVGNTNTTRDLREMIYFGEITNQ
jgi:hypothetical protein